MGQKNETQDFSMAALGAVGVMSVSLHSSQGKKVQPKTSNQVICNHSGNRHV